MKEKAQNVIDVAERETAKEQYEKLYKEYNEEKQTNHIYKCTFNLNENYTVDKNSIIVMAEDVDGDFTIPFEETLPGR